MAALAARIEPARSPQHGTPAPFIQPVSRDGKLLLSFAQQRLWFIHQLEPGSCAYNLFSATQLTGRLNVMALEQSFNEIIRRHEALRTVFRSVNGQPFQVNLPTLTINLPVMELRDVVSPAERGAESRRLCTEEARRPFDLANGPLLRATLLRLTDETYVLVLVLHHIIFDGWSRGVLDQEISIAYEALSCGQSPSLPALSLQYADFAQWQRQHLRGEALEGQLAYWKKQLETLSILQLPNDRPRPAIQTSRGARQSFTLPEDLVEGLKMLGRQEGVTLFMTLLAAYQTLLGRYTGQNDIAIGAPISGRDRSEFESLIGLFLNMLVLRTDLSGNPTFRELLCRARKVCLEAYANQDVPFEELVQELQPLRSLSHNPLFQVTFALQNSPTSLLKLTGMTARDLNLGSGIATFDLHLFMVEDETTLSGWLIYNTDLFDAASIARMVRHFQMILEAVVANPDQHISDLPLLTEAEKHQLLVEWCDRREEYTKDRCLHQRFEEQVVRTPEAVAVVFEDQQLTYRELNRSANRIARRLQGLGVGPDVLVGLYVERSIELIIGVLGILKAGGAYVPFDPSYPADRVEFMLRDADVSVLLTQIHLSTQLPACDSAVVYLDTEHLRNSSDDANESDFESSAKPDDLAYVIYTSGSTGKPNGVLITHRSAGAFLNWAHSAFTQEDFAGVIASTSICFDLSVFEIFAPLTAGGQVILVENALALAHVDEAVAPTLVNTVPSVMAELLRLGGLPKSIRTVNLAGEPLKASLVRQIHQQTSAQQVYDLYGPSETTTYSTYTERTADGTQTIGRPIANTQIYILDPHGNPAPIGIPGEIYIGGAGLARGYLNRPELTAEKFIANPFSTERGARLYRTGDSARYLPDGNIEFLGRLDNQVKIRGFRIELGEIEAVLGQHSSLREAVVLVREDNPGEKQLVAYTVAAAGFMPSVNELRGFLQQKLPEYMVPSAFVMLDSLPFTPNGKVDRKALPAPDQTRPELEETFVAPRTPIEQTLVAIWGKVLKLEKVGIHDNFFELGGHSLLATQVMSRIRSAFSIDLPLRCMFESPTVAEIAFIITESQAQPVSEAAIARMLSEVEVTTEEEAQKILAK
ncbi:MAG TPA: amino acid adenylation domain-containing protein [Candidatus Polarisedimenticolia bacterium]|nr:amino acid adenylation domain-containing protein [Candidatus Polarisedimenticolia bacterium]